MKKVLIVLAVMVLASFSSAAMVYEFRDATGTTPIAVVDMLVDVDFTLVLSNTYNAASGAERLYDAAGPGGVADMTDAILGGAAGPGGGISAYDTEYDGYDITWGDVGAQSGVVAIIYLTALETGTLTIDKLSDDYFTVLDSFSVNVIPEPMTIALLGLGGLLLRKRS